LLQQTLHIIVAFPWCHRLIGDKEGGTKTITHVYSTSVNIYTALQCRTSFSGKLTGWEQNYKSHFPGSHRLIGRVQDYLYGILKHVTVMT